MGENWERSSFRRRNQEFCSLHVVLAVSSSSFALPSEFGVVGFFMPFGSHLNITSSDMSSLTTLSKVASQPFFIDIWKVLAGISSILCLFSAAFMRLGCKVRENKSLAAFSLLFPRPEQICHVTHTEEIVVE